MIFNTMELSKNGWRQRFAQSGEAFGQSAHASNRQLELVPHDTAFYFGTGKPVAVEDLFAVVPNFFKKRGKIFENAMNSAKSDEQRQFLEQLSAFFDDPAKVTRDWGLGDELHFSAYAVGLQPVFRIEGDSEQFEAAIAKLEAKHEFESEYRKGRWPDSGSD